MVEFASVDDLERIVAMMAPTVGRGRASYVPAEDAADAEAAGEAWQSAPRSTAAEALAAQWATTADTADTADAADTSDEPPAEHRPVSLHAAEWQRPAEAREFGVAGDTAESSLAGDTPEPGLADGAAEPPQASPADEVAEFHLDDTPAGGEVAADEADGESRGQGASVAPPTGDDASASEHRDEATDQAGLSIVDSAESQSAEGDGAGTEEKAHDGEQE